MGGENIPWARWIARSGPGRPVRPIDDECAVIPRSTLPRNTQCLQGQNANSSEAASPPSSGRWPPSPPKKPGGEGSRLHTLARTHSTNDQPSSRCAHTESLLPSAEGRRCRRRMRGRSRGRYVASVSFSQARRARRGPARDDKPHYIWLAGAACAVFNRQPAAELRNGARRSSRPGRGSSSRSPDRSFPAGGGAGAISVARALGADASRTR